MFHGYKDVHIMFHNSDRQIKLNECHIIRIFHEYEILIEKSVPRVTVWHHKATSSDAKL